MSLVIIYKACACTVWPLDALSPVRHCGRCNQVPWKPATEADRERYLATGDLP